MLAMHGRLQTAVVGATGYSGAELARILDRHPCVKPPLLLRQSTAEHGAASRRAPDSPPLAGSNGDHRTQGFSWAVLEQAGVELLFLATPHEASRALVPEALARGMRIIDLSGAWRLKQAQNRAVYGFHDADPTAAAALDASAVYGLPELHRTELHRTKIANAALVANPGCYATSVILALAPLFAAHLVDETRGVISDSKSGVSGAGKAPTARTHFVSVSDNLSAYAVFEHRHVGEMVEQLGIERSILTFTPHLLPIPRGILSTVYVQTKERTTPAEIEASFRNFYDGRPWVRIFATPNLPEIRFSLHTNYCDIGFCLDQDGRRLVLVSCLDNLLKGAAGQAVQNMNLMYGWAEEAGLQ
jgi:N-acetyl-gamma-glutamyl-phosphate reductase